MISASARRSWSAVAMYWILLPCMAAEKIDFTCRSGHTTEGAIVGVHQAGHCVFDTAIAKQEMVEDCLQTQDALFHPIALSFTSIAATRC